MAMRRSFSLGYWYEDTAKRNPLGENIRVKMGKYLQSWKGADGIHYGSIMGVINVQGKRLPFPC